MARDVADHERDLSAGQLDEVVKVTADLARCAVFCALPFVSQPAAIVGLAAVYGIGSLLTASRRSRMRAAPAGAR